VIQVEVVGIRLELPSNQPVLILKDADNGRYLPLWIGTAEATSISLALDNILTTRPLTHDLMITLMQRAGAVMTSVTITELVDGTFMAVLQFANQDSLSARPSDAVALAIRLGIPVYVAEDVLDEAAIAIEEEQAEESDTQEELEKFRAFLEDLNPEDFSQ
jgi:bifunctional DNase/RNase